MAKPTRKKAKRRVAQRAKLPEGETKLSTNIPVEVHRKLKAVAALRGVSIRELLIEYSDSLRLDTSGARRRR